MSIKNGNRLSEESQITCIIFKRSLLYIQFHQTTYKKIMSVVTPQRLQELIMFLSSPVKSKRREGFDELAKVKVFPDLVPQTDERTH